MSIQFSDAAGGTGIVERARVLMRVDATQWPTLRIANSCNDYLDTVTGYMIGTDKRFQWDDTNHAKLPEGTTQLTINQTDYSFLTDEQGNAILTLTGISRLENGIYIPLKEADRNDLSVDLKNFGVNTGTPTSYDKIADNIIRLDFKPPATVASGLKFFFQRTGSYFVAGDTTKSPGVAPLLHRGFVVHSAYDGALSLGLKNLQGLGLERQIEREKMIEYFSGRNRDVNTRFVPFAENNK